MKLWSILLLVFTLTACAAPTADEAGTLPTNYKEAITAVVQNGYAGALMNHTMISQPQPGRIKFVPGWRVCLQGDLLNNTSYFFVDGHLQTVTNNDPLCKTYSYTPWPDLDGIVSRNSAFMAHPTWIYRTQRDDLHNTNQLIAELLSRNGFNLKFPYEGGTRAYLQVIKIDGGYKVSLALDRGVLECKLKCTIPIRFGDDGIQNIAFVHDDTADKSHMKAVDASGLIARLQAGKPLVAELGLYSNGHKQFLFEPSALDLARLDALAQAPQP